MNKNILKISILIATSLWAGQLMAGSATIPNTFVSGTAASASEVNANFGAIKTEVDDNDSRITTNITNITANTEVITAAVPQVVLKDANGVYVGRVVGMNNSSTPYVLTDKGYRALITLSSGRVQEFSDTLYYESINCQGPAYAYNLSENLRTLGTVFLPSYYSEAVYNAGLVLYTPSDEPSVAIAANSYLDLNDPNNCIPLVSPLSVPVTRAYPNDPDITGIQNTAYPARMIIE